MSLNSLVLTGVRLLSPRDSQILPKTVAGADDTNAGDTTGLKWDRRTFDRFYVLFPDDR